MEINSNVWVIHVILSIEQTPPLTVFFVENFVPLMPLFQHHRLFIFERLKTSNTLKENLASPLLFHLSPPPAYSLITVFQHSPISKSFQTTYLNPLTICISYSRICKYSLSVFVIQ